MAATRLGGGTFTTTANAGSVNATFASVPAGTNVLVVYGRLDATGNGAATATAAGVASSADAVNEASSTARHRCWVFEGTFSGSVAFVAALSSYGTVKGTWEAFNSDAAGAKFEAIATAAAATTAASSGSVTIAANALLSAGLVHSYSPGGIASTAGTEQQDVAISGDIRMATGTRDTTGAISWNGGGAFGWAMHSVVINGAAPPAPEITGPTGSAGDPTVALTVAENATAIGTWTVTDGETWGVSGTDAALVQISVGGVVSFIAAKNFEAPDDADTNGVYLFNVTNGSASQAVTLTLTDVAEPPGAPTIGTATAGNASASVAFTPPADNGGPAVTSYTATSSPGGLTGTGASSPITVAGLTNGVEYTFGVTATNAEGTGPASAASNPVTPAAVTYSLTSPAGGFAPNTGAGARAPGLAFNWWAFSNKVIGDSLAGATMQTGSGTLDGSGRAVIPGLTLAGSWECQVRFADGGTARWTGTAA